MNMSSSNCRTLLPVCIWAIITATAAAQNVVLMVSDDQGLDMGCYGNTAIKTPNMDRLAAEGTRFSHAFCTTASCSASRSVILTGLYNHANGQFGHAHGFHDFTTHAWVQSLPMLLSRAGYRTCIIGKYHVQPREVYPFDEFANKGILGGARNPVGMAANAEAFIRSEDDRPFFLYFCTVDPHRAQVGFANDQEYPGVTPVTYDPADVIVPPFLPDRPEVREELAEYYQSVSRVDQGLGRLMEVLKETGHWDDTLFIYISDNGIPFPGAKTTLYDAGMHLPMLMRSPKHSRAGSVCKAMVTWADITPTILDYTGAKGPDYPLQGRSFLNVLDQPDAEGWDEIYASHTFHGVSEYYPMRVVRTRRYKYILNIAHPLPFPFASDLYASPTWQGVLKRGDAMYGRRRVEDYIHRPKHELYDLKEDPHEVHNLADDAEHAKVLKELQSKLKDWQKRTKDPWVYKYEYE